MRGPDQSSRRVCRCGRRSAGQDGERPGRRLHPADRGSRRQPAQLAAGAGGTEMSIVLSLIRNEFEKTWRSRWIVFVVLGGLFVLIAGGLYTFYVFHEHRWTPPATVSSQAQRQHQIAVDQRNVADLEQIN